MKTLNKLLVLLIAASVALSATACGKKGTEEIGNSDYTGEKTEIELWLWEAGYGKEYIKNIAKAFVEEYPMYTIKIEATADSEFLSNKLPLNAELNSADLMMSVSLGRNMMEYCEPINDVLDYVNPGETKSIKEKIGTAITDSLVYGDGKYYNVPYVSGYTGLTYNEDILKDYYIPNTTDELIALVNELVSDHKVPFIHFTGGGYWDAMFNMWQGQYLGVDVIHDIYENPTLDKVTSDDNGVLEALKVLEECLNSPKKYVNGSNAFNFTDAQTLYLEGESVMMVNGSWMEYEMSGNYEPGTKNFKMMKTPVISSIINKCPSIEDDDELSSLVKAIDAGKTTLVGTGYEVTQDDYNRVAEARKIMYNHCIGHAACVPKYSDNIKGAKDFLKFYFSDRALKIFADTTKTKSIADFDGNVTIDTSTWSTWQKTQLKIDSECVPFSETGNNQHVLYSIGGMSLTADVAYISKLSTNSASDRMTAQEIWNDIKVYHNNTWNRYHANAGL